MRNLDVFCNAHVICTTYKTRNAHAICNAHVICNALVICNPFALHSTIHFIKFVSDDQTVRVGRIAGEAFPVSSKGQSMSAGCSKKQHGQLGPGLQKQNYDAGRKSNMDSWVLARKSKNMTQVEKATWTAGSWPAKVKI